MLNGITLYISLGQQLTTFVAVRHHVSVYGSCHIITISSVDSALNSKQMGKKYLNMEIPLISVWDGYQQGDAHFMTTLLHSGEISTYAAWEADRSWILNVHGFIPVPHAPTLMFIAHCT
jgi:hypothetical protein